ncbi:mannose 6-phosphate receptor domain-containing protein [Viridothelium virens]|uniref:Mannose 6-phosphate receptor domain-containing protein n=1 Tax=Viridothelium virens TaxID=1048519 RepID=A0A6A6H057_VIRVR|nr:mannose 6-phosphate receptor domain-containing protein [Viridothelium virens]
MKISPSAWAAAALIFPNPLASAAKESAARSCTEKSSSTGSFFDLSPISIPSHGKKSAKNARKESWQANGYDYGSNFTLNFCAPVVEELDKVEGIREKEQEDVGAYYEDDGRVYSIGSANNKLKLRGRKLVLVYESGSPCGDKDGYDRRSLSPDSGYQGLSSRNSSKGKGRHGDDDDDDDDRDPDQEDDDDDDEDDGDGENNDDDYDDDDDGDDEDDDPPPTKGSKHQRRKSTVISFLCDRDPLKADASVAFVAASPDECTYFFEVRSPAACGRSESSRSGLGPGGVFGIIVLIALSVYLVGGCVYQRTVMHQRGWRQIPNYSFWASIFGFIQDLFIIVFSSCARFLPSRRGYTRVSANGSARGRGSNSEDENRLIDQLDEEWDD